MLWLKQLGKCLGEETDSSEKNFSARRDKDRILKNKKKLKDNQKIKEDARFGDKVIIMEDVTEARQKLLRIVRETPSVDFAFVQDGVVKCKCRDGRFHRIETADDLYHIGHDDAQYDAVYGHD